MEIFMADKIARRSALKEALNQIFKCFRAARSIFLWYPNSETQINKILDKKQTYLHKKMFLIMSNSL